MSFGLFPSNTNIATKQIEFEKDIVVPKPPPVGFFNTENGQAGPVKIAQNITKKQHMENVKGACVKPQGTSWKCAYDHISNSIPDTNPSSGNMTVSLTVASTIGDVLNTNKSGDGTIVDDYIQTGQETDIACNIVNILVSLGYKPAATNLTDDVPPSDDGDDTYDIFVKNVSGVDKKIFLRKVANNEQALYNACQLAVTQSREYSIKNLIGSQFQYSITDIFKSFPNQSLILIFMLFISVYLLVSGTFASGDVGYGIAYIISARSNTNSVFYWIGLLLGLFVPAGILVAYVTHLISENYKRLLPTNVKNVTEDPYGEDLKKDELKSGRITDIGLITLLIFLIYVVIFFVYFVATHKTLSKESRMVSVFILFLILSAMVYVLYYIAPILSSEGGDVKMMKDDFRVYATPQSGSNATVMTNLFVESSIRKTFLYYAIFAIVMTGIYLRSTKTSISSIDIIGAFKEGVLSSFAILVLPIIWVVNWMIGVNYFVIYPFVIMMVRYARYFLYYFFRNAYLADPEARRLHPHMKEEFDHPESYQAPWDLMGVTLMKYMMKKNGTSGEISEMVVDDRDGMKNVAGNSYVTGHFLRLMMRSPTSNTEVGYTYQGTIGAVTVTAVLVILYGIVGSKNIPFLQSSSEQTNAYNLVTKVSDDVAVASA
jgi:hypothetical protein